MEPSLLSFCSGFQSASHSWPSNGYEASGERILFPLKTPVCARSIFSLTASVTIMENCFSERMQCRLFSQTLEEMVQRCVSQHSVKLFLLSNLYIYIYNISAFEMQSLSQCFIYCLQIELRKNRGGLVGKDVNDSSRFNSLSDKDRARQFTKDRRQPIRDSSLKVTHTLLNMQLLSLTLVCFQLFCRHVSLFFFFPPCLISWRKI